jgi:plastocyanin
MEDIQHEKGGFTMRPRALLLFVLAALVGATVAVLPALAAAPSEARLEVNENCVESNWPCWAVSGSGANPQPASKVTIAAGGEVEFTDNASTAAAVVWTGSAPACSGVPASAMTAWQGTCKFEQPGIYMFESSTLFNGGPSLDYTKYEIVVEGATTGTSSTTTATATTPTTTTPTTTTAPATKTPTPSESSRGYGSPLEGGSGALKLAGSERGSIVHGSIKVSQAGSGGDLEVGLFATGASLARARHPTQTRIGRLVRSSLKAGDVSFFVPLSAKGRAALRRHRRLLLTVKITLAPPHGTAVTLTRMVVLHA